jgi:hypothetical protein
VAFSDAVVAVRRLAVTAGKADLPDVLDLLTEGDAYLLKTHSGLTELV